MKFLCFCNRKSIGKTRSKYLEEFCADKLTLIVNIDNSFIYVTPDKNQNFKENLYTGNNLYIYKRPYLENFLFEVLFNLKSIY